MPGSFTMSLAVLLRSLLLHAGSDGASAIAESAGLMPEALACAGLDSGATSRLLDGFAAADTERGQLSAAQSAMDRAVELIATLETQLEDAPGDESLQTELAAARDGLAAARTAWLRARGDLVAAASAGQDPDRMAHTLRCCEATSAGLPPEIGAFPLAEATAHEICLALIAEARSQRLGEAIPDHARDLLQQVRTHPDVVNAQAHLDLYQAEVKAMWSQRR